MSTFISEPMDTLRRPDLAKAAGLPKGWEVDSVFVARRRAQGYRVIGGAKAALGYLPSMLPGSPVRLFDEEVALIKKLAEELQQ